MIDAEVIARIRHLHHAEGWPVGTIATQLGLHHETVERALEERPLVLRLPRWVPQPRSVPVLPSGRRRLGA